MKEEESNIPSFKDAFPVLMNSLTEMLSKEKVTSNTSGNVYTILGTKAGSKVGVSVALDIAHSEAEGKPVAFLIIRMLEVPANGGFASAFEMPGETRQYFMGEKAVDVHMLTKLSKPLTSTFVSTYEMRQRLDEAKPNVIDYVWATLEGSGVAINCKTKEEMSDTLFARYEKYPEVPDNFWVPIDLTNIQPL